MLHVAVIILAFALMSQVMLTSTLHRRIRALEEEHDHLVEKVRDALKATADVVESMDKRTSGVIETADNALKAAQNVIAVGEEQNKEMRELKEKFESAWNQMKRELWE